MEFKNKQNDYIESVSSPGLWTLFFGPLYFLVKGLWKHFFIYIGIIIASIFFLEALEYTGRPPVLLLQIIYAFFANGIVRKHYLRKGWVQVKYKDFTEMKELID